MTSTADHFPYATGRCSEHMCQGTDGHVGDHYVQRRVNGRVVITRWEQTRTLTREEWASGLAHTDPISDDDADRILRQLKGGWDRD